jgi:queuine tRNA-ribosyltransferase
VSFFRVEAVSDNARLGVLSTPHGLVETPAFMPVATQATVKSLTPEEVSSTGTRLCIMNTYHLWLRPGAEVVAEQGGLHEFCRWPHAIATDSGGFQAFSLAERVKLSERGFEFSSHLDGRRLLLSPEESMRIQALLGSDIVMQLDICPPAGTSRDVLVAAVERTTRWAERCLSSVAQNQALFGIVQGGTDVELRLQHAEALSRLPLAGLALGGFSVGEPPAEMHRTLRSVAPGLDAARPRYLMGVGTPSDILRAVGCGVDLFDCVMPTRHARNGQAFVGAGRIVIKNARYKCDSSPLDAACECPACRGGFSRAYLRHAYVAGEIIALRLLTLHNVYAYAKLMQDIRQAIHDQRFTSFASERLRLLSADSLAAEQELSG